MSKNDWRVTIRFKNMIVKQHVDFPEPMDFEEAVDEQGMRELAEAFMGAQDGSIEYEIEKIEKVPE